LFLLFHATVWTAGPGCRQIPLATLARQGPSTSWPVAKERGSGIRVQGTGIRDPGPRNGHPGSGSKERASGIWVQGTGIRDPGLYQVFSCHFAMVRVTFMPNSQGSKPGFSDT